MPQHAAKPLLLSVTCVIVIFAIVVQRLTMQRVIRRFLPSMFE